MPHPLLVRTVDHAVHLRFLLADLLEATQMVRCDLKGLTCENSLHTPSGTLHGPLDRLRYLIELYQPPFGHLQLEQLRAAIHRSWDLAKERADRESLAGALSQVAHLFEELLPYYQKDEAFLLFLLNHGAALDALYGSSFVLRLFRQLFPGGLAEAELFLLGRYRARGYPHLLEQISRQIAQLESTGP